MWQWQYFLESSTWSIGGLLLGYILGRTERDVRIIRKKVTKDDDA